MKCEEQRINFVSDSLTIVIDREKVLQDSYYQYYTTEGFDFHKEIKVFFIGEVA